uniref:Class II aldolase/adducin N-terminal domain-containing protein n=1 Tax=Chromera velia CCMP2878 TaxID=1169474 RepID=A0A0G4HPZ9_9ALVE|eukprot:Cvel_7866.t1-p1 / transcript=Cvel_7866.t1 / gene=Cvel_7866 / organism=Chromera_velia_CCMP2878 / gene_product=L-fuculose phosphate aldolase, putative / transcript_product=L-fuculose phosphate aldolase, putative / location=Cvel_scaffold421:51992-53714(+) / protein_length=517 / sequence_SO=supercontig / SO=protein_coding / is_pseudo=false
MSTERKKRRVTDFAYEDEWKPPAQVLSDWMTRVYRHRLTTTSGGNLSMLDDDGIFYVTPKGGDKAFVDPQDVAYRPLNSNVPFKGRCPPSTEFPVHEAVYAARKDVNAILHAHSQSLVAFSIAEDTQDRTPNTLLLAESAWSVGTVGLVPYFLPGSQKLADAVAESFRQGADCVILQNHGVFCTGVSLDEAYMRFTSLESLAAATIQASAMVPPYSLCPLRKEDLVKADRPREATSPVEFQRNVSMEEKQTRTDLLKFIKRAYQQGLISSTSGSFSARVPFSNQTLGEGGGSGFTNPCAFVITPTGMDRHRLELSDLVFVESCDFGEGETEMSASVGGDGGFVKSAGMHSPSRAVGTHAAIYRQNPNVSAVMLAQPPAAVAFCITDAPFVSAGIPESFIVLGPVPVLQFEDAMRGGLVAETVKSAPVVLMRNSGVLAVGESLLKAFDRLEVCDAMARVQILARRRGAIRYLTDEEREEIEEKFLGGKKEKAKETGESKNGSASGHLKEKMEGPGCCC